MISNPSIFEINTRVWIKRFAEGLNPVKIDEIPVDYWQNLKNLGIDYIWLMGIWLTSPDSVSKYCFEEGLRLNYDRALRDWRKIDVIGSPYAIEDYIINPELGNVENILKLKDTLNKIGLKLILDFIPNHFNSSSKLIGTNPEVFLEATQEQYERDNHTFFISEFHNNKYFAHGRDPFFPGWLDTIQVNYFSSEARGFMVERLKYVSSLCDGVRCDMAMLCLNNIFENTWSGSINSMNYPHPETEFWYDAVSSVKNDKPDFLFIAEAYWDLEWKLQQLGFDYTYDKKLTDRLKYSPPKDIYDHLRAEEAYQKKSLRFIENHDEERSVKSFGDEMVKAAATVMCTVQGMHFFYDGQFEGKKIKLPVQLGREPIEKTDKEFKLFYELLLNITKQEVFKKGTWSLVEPRPSWENDNILSYKSFLAFRWDYNNEIVLVVINYDEKKNSCRLTTNLEGFNEDVELVDQWDNQIYMRSKSEIESLGLFVELQPYKSHIFKLLKD